MALRGCMQCFKYSVFTLNFIIWLSGLLILVLAIYLRMDPTLNHMVAVGYSQHLSTYHLFCYFLVFFGVMVTFLGFLGCCSSYQESYTMLGFFLGILILFLIAEVGMASWLIMQKNNMKHSIEDSMKEYIHRNYGVDLFSNDPVDHIQENFICCGGSGPHDYWMSNWYNSTHVDTTHSRKRHNGQERHALVVPMSCCSTGTKSRKHLVCVAENSRRDHRVLEAAKSVKNVTVAYNQGCAGGILTSFDNNIERSCYFALAVSSVQLLSLIVSLCLCCGLRRRSAGGYKS